MPKIHVSRSVDIHAAPEKVHSLINNFNAWQAWSPWLIADPEATVKVAADGKSYAWEGPVTGAGEMEIEAEDPSNIHCNLLFLKPFKSKAKTYFTLDKTASGTRLTWVMNSSIPFFMFWMKKSMQVYIGMDYDRGLLMIKDLAEKETVLSSLEFMGRHAFSPTHYIAISNSCPIDELPQHMSKNYEALLSYVHDKNSAAEQQGHAFSMYHRWDPLKGEVRYTACVPLKKIPESLPEEFSVGELPTLQVYGVRHKGAYRHLGNAWSAVMMHERSKKFKSHKKYAGMEVYVNSPQDTKEPDLVSEILIPVRD